jgi:hypothetical protein
MTVDMDLTVFLEPDIDLERVTHILDGLGLSGRLDTIRGWDRLRLATLFEAAAGYKPIGLEHFVPASVGARTEVIHHGKNSLPAFSLFQQRFCRPSKDETGELWGFNRQDMEMWTGPGYFVAHPADTEGEVMIDYTQEPGGLVASSGGHHDGLTPEGWPEFAPSSARLGRYVYGGTVDIVRGLSSHVSIGRARRGREWMDAWFVLCREDVG